MTEVGVNVDMLASELAARRSRFWNVTDPRTVAEWVFDDPWEAEPLDALPGAVDALDQARAVLDEEDPIGLFEPIALGLVGAAARLTVPEPVRAAGRHWLVTVQRRGVNSAARLTVGIAETAIAYWAPGAFRFTLRLAASPIDEALESGDLSSAEMEELGIWKGEDSLRSFADDAARYHCRTLEAAMWLLDQPAVVRAARLMNARLAAGRFPFAANYSPALAAQMWAAAEALYEDFYDEFADDEDQELSRDPGSDTSLRPEGFDRPYRGKPAEGEYPEVQATSPEAREMAIAEHDALCRRLIDHLTNAGVAAGELVDPPVDVAWRDRRGAQFIAEVKSCVGGNHADQLRLGLGQVLEYRQRMAETGEVAEVVLLVTTVKDPFWYDICASVGVRLLAGDDERSWDLG